MDVLDRNKAYNKFVDAKTPKTKWWPSLIWAFIIGGIICVMGEGIAELAKLIWPKLPKEDIGAISSCSLIFIASLLTGFGVFDKIAKFAGAGTTIPISGFSNATTSPAIEFKSEGLIFGTSAKMFLISGPVIVNGLVMSFVIGVIYLIFGF